MQAASSGLSFEHLRPSSVSPTFLHTNALGHTWAFGALAELIDNATYVGATQLSIDVVPKNDDKIGSVPSGYTVTEMQNPSLVLLDNGPGLSRDGLHRMLSFGSCGTTSGRSTRTCGSGFTSGAMRLGKDCLVFTKDGQTKNIGFLSQTFLFDIGKSDVVVPIVSWDMSGNLVSEAPDASESLDALLHYTPFDSEERIMRQFERIQGTGTLIILSDLWRNDKGILELDFNTDPDDVRLVHEKDINYRQHRDNQPSGRGVRLDYSLRAYCSVLYLEPHMQIYINGKKVHTRRVAHHLSHTRNDLVTEEGDVVAKVSIGYAIEDGSLSGILFYSRNRLIKPCVHLGIQADDCERIVGVVEADFLRPTLNKQDFHDSKNYRLLRRALEEKLNEYWCETRTHQHDDAPDELWVQCDNLECLKWRRIPSSVGKEPTPWYCRMNEWDTRHARCEAPQQDNKDTSILERRHQNANRQHKIELATSHLPRRTLTKRSVSTPGDVVRGTKRSYRSEDTTDSGTKRTKETPDGVSGREEGSSHWEALAPDTSRELPPTPPPSSSGLLAPGSVPSPYTSSSPTIMGRSRSETSSEGVRGAHTTFPQRSGTSGPSSTHSSPRLTGQLPGNSPILRPSHHSSMLPPLSPAFVPPPSPDRHGSDVLSQRLAGNFRYVLQHLAPPGYFDDPLDEETLSFSVDVSHFCKAVRKHHSEELMRFRDKEQALDRLRIVIKQFLKGTDVESLAGRISGSDVDELFLGHVRRVANTGRSTPSDSEGPRGTST